MLITSEGQTPLINYEKTDQIREKFPSPNYSSLAVSYYYITKPYEYL